MLKEIVKKQTIRKAQTDRFHTCKLALPAVGQSSEFQSSLVLGSSEGGKLRGLVDSSGSGGKALAPVTASLSSLVFSKPYIDFFPLQQICWTNTSPLPASYRDGSKVCAHAHMQDGGGEGERASY